VFEFNLETNELEALDALLTACVDQEENLLPSWTYMGQDIWKMEFDGDAPEMASEWAIKTADVA
jgi:hypothetical protein